MSDDIFIDGLRVFAPRDNAPDFVKAGGLITRKELGNWLRGRTEDEIRFDILQSKNGNYYVKINNYKPAEKDSASKKEDFVDDDIPF